MKTKLWIIIGGLFLSCGYPTFLTACNDSLYMLIPQGQIYSRVFKVFVPDRVITAGMNPTLSLMRTKDKKEKSFSPVKVAPNQVIKEFFDGASVTSQGTLILFNIKDLDFPIWYSSVRVLPMLNWTEQVSDTLSKRNESKKLSIIHTSCYYIGNGNGTAIWTTVTFLIILGFIYLVLIMRKKERQIIGLISDEDGCVSMSLFQMLLWTIAVGLMVLAFGLLRLDVPEIPATLIMLMLFAAGTTTAGQIQSKIKQRKESQVELERTKRNKTKSKSQEANSKTHQGSFSTIFYANKDSEYPSMAKVQVLCWTVITLMLFIYLSIKEGKLWDIPPGLVALMGISQATFLGRQQMAIQDVKDQIKDLPLKEGKKKQKK